MRRVEVRCCCDANKLMGTLPMPDGHDSWAFPLMRESNANFAAAAARSCAYDKVVLNLLRWKHHVADPESGAIRTVAAGVALKADGIPIETLRRIPGFIEAGLPPLFTKD
jgi:hypothetical protein